MAEQLYKVNSPIRVDYQATIGSTTATMDVYDETNTKDVSQSGVMSQVGATRIWNKSFTPDEIGDWRVECKDDKGGQVIRSFSVGVKNIQDIGTEMAKDSTVAKETTLNSRLDGILAILDSIASPPMIG